MQLVWFLFFITALSRKPVSMDECKALGSWQTCNCQKEFYIVPSHVKGDEASTWCKKLVDGSSLATNNDVGFIMKSCPGLILSDCNFNLWINFTKSNAKCSILHEPAIWHFRLFKAPCHEEYSPLCMTNISHDTPASCPDIPTVPARKSTTTPRTPSSSSTTSTRTTISSSKTSTRTTLLSPTSSSSSSTTTPRTTILSSSSSSSKTSSTAIVTTCPVSTTSMTSETNKTIKPNTDNSTTRTTHGDYFINYKSLNHSAAVDECKSCHEGSLITTGSITAYFNTLTQLQLRNGTYWVDGNTGRDAGCIRYDEHTGGIYLAYCGEKRYSICGCKTLSIREDILEDPEFKKLIMDMTVDKSTTARAKNKLQSMNDHRPSAKVVGTVGISVMVIVGMFVVLIDFINVVKACSCKKSTVHIGRCSKRET